MSVKYPSIHAIGVSTAGNTGGNTGTQQAASFVLIGSNNITLSQSTGANQVHSIYISGGAGGGGADGYNIIAAGTQTAQTTGTVVLSNSNGITFGMSNSSVVTASHNGLTSQSNQALSAGNGSFTFQTATFADSNGVSFSTGTQGIYATVKTDYLTSQSNQALSGSNGSFAFQTATFGSSNGMHFYTTNGSRVGSYTVPTQTNQSGGIYALGNTTGQSSSSTYDARTLSVEGAGIVSVGWSNSSLRISGTQSNQALSAAGGSSAFQTLNFADTNGVSFTNTNGSVGIASVKLSLFAASNTTQSSSGTANHSALTFAGAGIASVGVTNGSVLVSVPAGGGGGDGVNIIAAGTQTANTTGTVLFSNSNGITFGMSDSSVVTASHNGLTVGIQSISGGTTRATSGEVVFSNSNGISFGVNGQTMTAKMPSVTYYEPIQWITGQNLNNGTMFMQPVLVPFQISATRANFLVHVSNSSSAGGTVTFSVGMYTLNGSTASLASSASRTMGYNSTAAASSYTHMSGTRYWSVDLGTWNMTPGQYMLAAWLSASTSGTSGTYSVFGRTANTVNAIPFAGGNYSDQGWGIGIFSATFTSAMPSSVHLSNMVQSGNTVVRVPWNNFFGTF